MNVDTIKNNIKNIFLSDQNTLYILNLLKQFNKNDQFIELNNEDIYKLENVIFDIYFDDIYKDLNANNKFTPEEILIILNKIIITEMENFIISNQSSFKNKPLQKQNHIHDIKENDIKVKEKDVKENDVKEKDVKEKDVTEKTIKENDEINTLNNIIQLSETALHYFHFFSDDSKRVGNKWTYKLDLQNIHSICLDSFKLNCNLYNINEDNNKFELIEWNNSRVTVSIPHGYYTIDALLNCITNLLNELSPNKFKYSVTRNQQKNKVYFSSIFNSSKLTNKTHMAFTINFLESNKNYSLGEILGFTNLEYSNNTTYISENFPKENIYDDIYLKISINDINLPKYISSKYINKDTKFTYFEKFTINMNKNFGKQFLYNKLNILDHFDFNKPINSNYISFEFMNSPIHSIGLDLDFNISLSFETA